MIFYNNNVRRDPSFRIFFTTNGNNSCLFFVSIQVLERQNIRNAKILIITMAKDMSLRAIVTFFHMMLSCHLKIQLYFYRYLSKKKPLYHRGLLSGAENE